MLSGLSPKQYAQYCRDAKRHNLSPLDFGLCVLDMLDTIADLREAGKQSAIRRALRNDH
jgi:hypothetical protein